MEYLQPYYEEKSSVTSVTQMPIEGPVDFILRRTELREKLVLKSKTNGEVESMTKFFFHVSS